MPIVRIARLVASLAFAAALGMSGPQPAAAASAAEIDAEVDATLVRFYQEVPAAKELAKKALGMLIFPSVVKAGFGVGGEYGEGALRIGGRSVGYYNICAARSASRSVQARAEILLFTSRDALVRFRASDGWEVGVDDSVAVVDVGAGGEIDTTTLNAPVIGFMFGERGLMANLSPRGHQDHQAGQVLARGHRRCLRRPWPRACGGSSGTTPLPAARGSARSWRSGSTARSSFGGNGAPGAQARRAGQRRSAPQPVHLDRRDGAAVVDLGLADRDPTGLDAGVLEAQRDQLLDQLLEQVDVGARGVQSRSR